MDSCPIVDVTEERVCRWLPRRPEEGHKGTFGKVNLLAGSVGFTGAALLCSKSAVRGGCGLVFLGVPALDGDDRAYRVIAGASLEAMPYPVDGAAAFLTKTTPDAALIGPGLGQNEQIRRMALDCFEKLDCPVVLDADGINAVSAHISLLDRRRRPTLLTPHDGEFWRLTGHFPTENRAEDALAFAEAHRCILVLKGHRTLTACPDGRIFRNTTGNDGMAKGGSGDVLAGLMVSLLAQGMEPGEAAASAVWIHGRAGDLAAERYGHRGMTPGDMIALLPEVWTALEG